MLIAHMFIPIWLIVLLVVLGLGSFAGFMSVIESLQIAVAELELELEEAENK